MVTSNPANISTLFQRCLLVGMTWRRGTNVQSTLKQRYVFQRWNLQSRTNVVYFNVDVSHVRKRQNNVVLLNFDFHNLYQRGNKVVEMTIFKRNKNKKNHLKLRKPLRNNYVFFVYVLSNVTF